MTTSLIPSTASQDVHIDLLNNQTPVVSSLDIARHFQKKHKNVLRDIQQMKSILPKKFVELNFEPMLTNVAIGNGAIRKDPAYSLTRDAFSLLVMGFTGAAAIRWKLRYIEAFNALEHTALQSLTELAREAGYQQGLDYANSAPALQVATKQAYLDGLTEGMGNAEKLRTVPEAIMKLTPRLLTVLKVSLRYAQMGLTSREIAKITDGNQRQIGHMISLARKMGLLPAYVRGKKAKLNQANNQANFTQLMLSDCVDVPHV